MPCDSLPAQCVQEWVISAFCAFSNRPNSRKNVDLALPLLSAAFTVFCIPLKTLEASHGNPFQSPFFARAQNCPVRIPRGQEPSTRRRRGARVLSRGSVL